MADPASCNLLPSLVSGQYTGPSESVLQAHNYFSCDAERLFMSVDDPSSIACPDLEHNDTHENGIILFYNINIKVHYYIEQVKRIVICLPVRQRWTSFCLRTSVTRSSKSWLIYPFTVGPSPRYSCLHIH